MRRSNVQGLLKVNGFRGRAAGSAGPRARGTATAASRRLSRRGSRGSSLLAVLVLAVLLIAAGCGPAAEMPSALDPGAEIGGAVTDAGGGGALDLDPDSSPRGEASGDGGEGGDLSSEEEGHKSGVGDGSPGSNPDTGSGGDEGSYSEDPGSTGGGGSGDGGSSESDPARGGAPAPVETPPIPSPGGGDDDAADDPSDEPDGEHGTLAIHGPVGTGMILDFTEVTVEEGDTVLDVMIRETRSRRLQMEFSGRGAMAYVKGIDNLYEFDEGPESGWLYRVNGVFPDRSAGIWPVEPGDLIEWLYTRDLGRDVGGYVDGVDGG